jgi:protein SCO1/2
MLLKRPAVVAVLALLVACIGIVLFRALVPGGPAAPDFTLTDQNGQPYTLSAHRGHVIALFFGYAHCPDVCPTTLSALAVAKRKLGVAEPNFDVVLVTVDPKRDSPAVLKRYVHLFDPAFMAVTGSEASLDPVYAAYHIVHEIDTTHKSANGYTVDHSSVVQFISPAGKLRGTGNYSDTPDELATLIKQSFS